MSDNRDEFTQWWDKAHGNFRGSAVYKSVARSAWEARDEKLGQLERDRARLLEALKLCQSSLQKLSFADDETTKARNAAYRVLASLEIKE